MAARIDSPGREDGRADAVVGSVQQTLARYRSDLCGGRGPGISRADWLANTSLRPTVGGVPTATSREELHLRTLRARGEPARAAAEAVWAAAQFHPGAGTAGDPRARSAAAGSGGPTRHAWQVFAAAGWLAAVWSWSRGRGRRTTPTTRKR